MKDLRSRIRSESEEGETRNLGHRGGGAPPCYLGGQGKQSEGGKHREGQVCTPLWGKEHSGSQERRKG